MEKKYYMTPEMEILNLKLEGFLCASHDFEDGDQIPFNQGDAGDDEGF